MLVEEFLQDLGLATPGTAVRGELLDKRATGEETSAEHILHDAVERAPRYDRGQVKDRAGWRCQRHVSEACSFRQQEAVGSMDDGALHVRTPCERNGEFDDPLDPFDAPHDCC